jgi:Protein of unknown function (DUF1570)
MLQHWLVTCALLITLNAIETASAQQINPRQFGIDLPPCEVKSGNDTRVTTLDAFNQPVVAKLYVTLGNSAMVLLPDGQLLLKKASEVIETERPFVVADKEALAKQLQADIFPKFKSRITKNYLFLYDTSEEFAQGTSRIMESMLPGLQKFMDSLKIPSHDPAVPLVVVMFRTEEQFQRYRRMPTGVVAYYDPLSNRVFMYEESTGGKQRQDLAIQQAISTIAHEGTHQILHNIGVQQRMSRWPMWISEGIAEYLAPTSFGKRYTWKGAAQVNDLRMFELEQYVKSKGTAQPNGDTVKHTVIAGQLTSTGYATAWSLTHYLATKKRPEFTKYLQDVAKLSPFQGAVNIKPPGVVAENLTLFERHFGSDATDLETKLVAHLKKLPYDDPFAAYPHFAAMITYTQAKRPKREISTFHSPELAAKWLTEKREKLGEFQPEAVLREFPNRAAAENFARGWLRGN